MGPRHQTYSGVWRKDTRIGSVPRLTYHATSHWGQLTMTSGWPISDIYDQQIPFFPALSVICKLILDIIIQVYSSIAMYKKIKFQNNSPPPPYCFFCHLLFHLENLL